MDVREKLVELLDEAEEWADHKCDELDCETCPASKMNGNCVQQLMVDRLIAHGVTVQEWVSVKDRLPQGADGKSLCENVIAYLNNGEVEAQVCPGWLNGDKWYLLVGDEDYHTVWGLGAVTHWQPMPQPPKGE